MNALTKLANPRVVARTSAFQFKGQALCEVGKKFDVTAVLEGSVRRAITGDSEADQCERWLSPANRGDRSHGDQRDKSRQQRVLDQVLSAIVLYETLETLVHLDDLPIITPP